MDVTADLLVRGLACTPSQAANWAPWLDATCKKWGITTAFQLAGFLGNCAEESGNFTTLVENLNYSAARLCVVWPTRFPNLAAAQPYAMNPKALANKVYAGRLGNTQPNDGGNFLGRGLIQLTGRDWYTKYAAASGVDAVNHPELLQTPQYAADSAGWFFNVDGCLPFCDRQDWLGLTLRVNGGTTNQAQRVSNITKLLQVLNG